MSQIKQLCKGLKNASFSMANSVRSCVNDPVISPVNTLLMNSKSQLFSNLVEYDVNFENYA